MAKSEPCGICGKDVTSNDKGMLCEGLCEMWYHIGCVRISDSYYEELQIDAETKWRCLTCDKEPFLTICKDIKYLQAVIFSISGKVSFSTLDNISKDVKSFIYDLAVKNENHLDELNRKVLVDKIGLAGLEDDSYHNEMNTFHKINYVPFAEGNYCDKSETFINNNNTLKLSYAGTNIQNSMGDKDVETHYRKELDFVEKELSPKLLKTVPDSLIISSTPGVFDELHVRGQEIDSRDSLRVAKSTTMEAVEVKMETSEKQVNGTGDGQLTEETATPTPSSNQLANSEDADQNNQSLLDSEVSDLSGVRTLPAVKSKSGSDQASNDYYEVEDILDHMRVQGRTLFLVKWENYDHEYNSWESSEDLTSCKRVISKYFRRSLDKFEELMKESNEETVPKE